VDSEYQSALPDNPIVASFPPKDRLKFHLKKLS
jgi:hypothetical protein